MNLISSGRMFAPNIGPYISAFALTWALLLSVLTCGCGNHSSTEEEDPSFSSARLAFQDNTYDIFEVDLTQNKLCFYLRDDRGDHYENFARLKQQLDRAGKQLVFATNGGIFQPSFEPNGLYIEEGKMIFPLETADGDGNFYLKPNGVFQVGEKGAAILPSSEWKASPGIRCATQSGPLLLRNGKQHEALRMASHSMYVRSGVGLISPTRVVFVISNEPVNFYDFTMFFKDRLKCRDALYLDGQISKMYLPELDRHELEGRFGPMIAVAR